MLQYACGDRLSGRTGDSESPSLGPSPCAIQSSMTWDQKAAKVGQEEARQRRLAETPFEKLGKRSQRVLMLQEQNNRCAGCGNPFEWLGQSLIPEHHLIRLTEVVPIPSCCALIVMPSPRIMASKAIIMHLKLKAGYARTCAERSLGKSKPALTMIGWNHDPG